MVKGPTLAESLDLFEPPEKPLGKATQDTNPGCLLNTGVGTVPVGRVETGVLKANQKVMVMPSGVTVKSNP